MKSVSKETDFTFFKTNASHQQHLIFLWSHSYSQEHDFFPSKRETPIYYGRKRVGQKHSPQGYLWLT